MPKIQYIGISHYREITKDDFKGAGVEDQEGVGWDRDNRRDKEGFSQVNEVSEGAAGLLLKDKEFTAVDGDDITILLPVSAGPEYIAPKTPVLPVNSDPVE